MSFAEQQAERERIKAIQQRTISNQLNQAGRAGEVTRQRHVAARGADATAAASGRTVENINSGIARNTSTNQSFRASGGTQELGTGFTGDANTLARQAMIRQNIQGFNSGANAETRESIIRQINDPRTDPRERQALMGLLGGGSGSGTDNSEQLAALTEQLTALQTQQSEFNDRFSNVSTSDATAGLPSPPATGGSGIKTQDSQAIKSLSDQVRDLIAAQKEGFSDEALRLEQQKLVAGLGSDAERAGQQAVEQLSVPKFQRSPLEGALESRFINDIANPNTRDVGIGDTGGLLEDQLRARLTGGFDQDAIGNAAQQRFATESADRREALVAELSGLGVLRGGGNTIDSFGKFDSGISQGIADIDAQTQLRRDDDLARALQFSQFESGLGLQNRQLGQQDLNQAAGFEQSQSDRTQRQREFEFGANATRLDLQQSVADRTLARLLTQTDATGRERFEEGVRQAQSAEALAGSRFGLEQNAFNQQIRQQNVANQQFDRNLALQQQGLRQEGAIARQGLTQQGNQFVASQLQQNQQFGQSLTEQELARLQQNQQFTDASQIQQNQFGRQANFQDAQLAQQQNQFALNLLEQQGQFGQNLGLQRDQLSQQDRQFLSAQEVQQAQFGRQANFQDTQLAQQQNQFGLNLQEQQAQFGQNLGLQRDQLSQQDRQFIDSQAQQAGQFGRSANQVDLARELQNTQFGLSLQEQQAQFGQNLDFQNRQLSQQQLQFLAAQSQQANQFGRTANQTDTQLFNQNNQFNQQLAEQVQGRQQQEGQFARSLTDAAQARALQNQQFSLQQAQQAGQFTAANALQNNQFGRSLGQNATQFNTQEARLAQEQQFQQNQQIAALVQQLVGDDQFLKPEDRHSTDPKKLRKRELQDQLIAMLEAQGITLTNA